jgi:hypothetical protein
MVVVLDSMFYAGCCIPVLLYHTLFSSDLLRILTLLPRSWTSSRALASSGIRLLFLVFQTACRVQYLWPPSQSRSHSTVAQILGVAGFNKHRPSYREDQRVLVCNRSPLLLGYRDVRACGQDLACQVFHSSADVDFTAVDGIEPRSDDDELYMIPSAVVTKHNRTGHRSPDPPWLVSCTACSASPLLRCWMGY